MDWEMVLLVCRLRILRLLDQLNGSETPTESAADGSRLIEMETGKGKWSQHMLHTHTHTPATHWVPDGY